MLAESMAKAVPSAREYELVSKTGKLVKDKELFPRCVKGTYPDFQRRLRLGGGRGNTGCPIGERRLSCPALTRKKLMALLDTAGQARAMLERNVNQALLATWLCAKLK